MTREELTKEIAKRVKDIRELYYKEYPKGTYLEMEICEDLIDFHNCYCDEDEDYPIDYYEDSECIGINEVWEDK